MKVVLTVDEGTTDEGRVWLQVSRAEARGIAKLLDAGAYIPNGVTFFDDAMIYVPFEDVLRERKEMG